MNCCWWCKHDIGNARIGVPTLREYKPRLKTDSFTLNSTRPLPIEKELKKYIYEGQFCTFECARAYLIDRHDYQYEAKIQMLSYKRREIMKEKGIAYKDIPRFKSAPSWKTLKEFGGKLTYEEFRSTEDEWIMHPDNVIINPVNITKKNRTITQDVTWKEKQDLIHNSVKTTEQLKIKRSNPRKNVSGFGDITSKLGIKKSTKE